MRAPLARSAHPPLQQEPRDSGLECPRLFPVREAEQPGRSVQCSLTHTDQTNGKTKRKERGEIPSASLQLSQRLFTKDKQMAGSEGCTLKQLENAR